MTAGPTVSLARAGEGAGTALPRIAPYLPPTVFPAGRAAAWSIDPSRAALLVHDMQEHFVGAFEDDEQRGVAGGPVGDAIANIVRLRRAAAGAGVPVVYTVQPPDQDPADRGLLQDFWGAGLRGDRAAGVVEPLAPGADDIVVTKWRYNAFIRTTLLEQLRDLGRDQLIVVGIYAHLGCLLTAAHAFMNDIQPFLLGDAVADFSREHHDSALGYAAGRCAQVMSTGEALAQLGHPV